MLAQQDLPTKVREIERKYEAGEDFAVPAMPGFDVGTSQESLLEAVYFDTVDLRLARAGVTVRRRTGGSDAGWHAKLPVAPDVREEIRLPLGRTKTKVPAELAAVLRGYSLGQDLVPAARIRTERSEWEVVDGDGAVVALVADDRVSARKESAPEDEQSWREIEVEVAPAGDRSVLGVIGGLLVDAGAEPASTGSKLGKVLGVWRESPASAPSRSSSAGEVMHAYLAAQADAIRAHDAGVRTDTDDAVHQLRVACRRLRSVLRAYRSLLDTDLDPLRADLKWLAGELGGARDSEVLAARLTDRVRSLPPELVLGPVQAYLTTHFARTHADALATALSALDSDRYLALLGKLDQLVKDPPWTAAASSPARTELREPLGKAWRRLERSVAAADLPAGVERDAALHQARKDAKKARYTAEAALPAFGDRLDEWRSLVKKVQTRLGEHQDAVVAAPIVRELAVRAHLDGGNGFTFGLLHAAETAAAVEARSAFEKSWVALRRGTRPQWL